MKPSFALTLTSDTVGLLQRTADGWQDVGDVSFDAPEFPAALGALRATATEKAATGITTKIVVPNSQILYTEVTAPGPDTGTRRSQIRAALEGLTPYAVKELVFDWHGTGERVKVAVVARETLQEAEAFAEEHQFNPLSFVGAPDASQFGKEPWFGTTAGAQKRLPKGEKVERDAEAIRIGMPTPEAPPEPPALTEPELAAPEPTVPPEQTALTPEVMAERFSDVMPEPKVTPGPLAEDPSLPFAEPHQAALAQASNAPATVSNAEQPKGPVADLPPAPVATETMDVPDLTTPLEAPPVEPLPAPEPEFVPPPFTRVSDKPIPHARDLPPFTPPPSPLAPEPVKKRPQPSVAASGIPDAPFVEASEASDRTAAFASRRAAEGGASAAAASFGAVRTAKPSEMPDRARPLPAKPFGAGPVAAPAAAAQRASGLSVTAPTLPGGRNRKSSKPVPQPAIPPRPAPAATATPAAKGNSLGGFGARQLPQRGKPRHLGIILTGLLLLVLAAIAAWSSFSGSSDSTAGAEGAALSDVAVPAVDEEMLADLQDPTDFAPEADAALPDAQAPDTMAALPESDNETELPPPSETVLAPAAVDPAAEPVDAPAAEAPQVTEATSAPLTAPAEGPQDEIFLTTMDTPQPTLDAVALPNPPVAPDAAPGAQMEPPPFGTVYDFDAAGMIVPTVEGIVAPGGFTLIAGAPPIRPPSRPAPEVPAVEPTEPEAALVPGASTTTPGSIVQIAPAAETPEAQTTADPALADARPRSRPAALDPAPQTAEEEAVPAEPATAVASLRPRVRPAGIIPDVETAQQAAQGATLMMAAAPAPRPEGVPDVAAAADGSISPLAIAVSRKPVARPSDFSGAIEAAVAAAVQQPAAPAAAAAIARVEPEEQDEPEVVAAVAPRIPTRASVAQQATFANAINLREINLIGVYGTSSNRYALVRQANGKYRRVSVGDRLDGGTVAAITTSELRYRKGSRMLALTMPRG